MPVLSSDYPGPPRLQFSPYLQTIVPNRLRKVPQLPYRRERLTLPDEDFLDLDWLEAGHDRLVIITHGLEGNSRRPYIRAMAQLFHQNGWDVLAWNCRSCSGEINRAPRLYYHGDTEDLNSVIEWVGQQSAYTEAALIGISMGGSINLKYAGLHSPPDWLTRVVAISTPCDLAAAAGAMDRFWNRVIFKKRFLEGLEQKLRLKNEQYPGLIDPDNFEKIEKWSDFDTYFSAPMFGFSSAEELYKAGSALHYLEGIEVPTLILNAWNDPLLPDSCFPRKQCESLADVYLETTSSGGHVGFSQKGHYFTYAERRALKFCCA